MREHGFIQAFRNVGVKLIPILAFGVLAVHFGSPVAAQEKVTAIQGGHAD